MFKITHGKGFHITFKNGITVSVQFGEFNYCGKYPRNLMNRDQKQAIKGVEDAEIAIFESKKIGRWLTKEFTKDNSDVLGYQTPEQVLEALIWAKNYKKEE